MVVHTLASIPSGQFADTEGPSNAIDGRTSTRWHSTVLSPLVIKLPKPAPRQHQSLVDHQLK